VSNTNVLGHAVSVTTIVHVSTLLGLANKRGTHKSQDATVSAVIFTVEATTLLSIIPNISAKAVRLPVSTQSNVTVANFSALLSISPAQQLSTIVTVSFSRV